ncbi:hypothetical protein [Peribacillus frigoritolerans]|uniref:hypothetical protein n=1 Tax=Peribacillus frigoritolerans TaxID=450367 RepID=UPI00227F6E0F|nr:hypothetical protein [Peribacillus frigoritolerans]MCY8938081.1 hypothetical protein [Peribacillus frigoritolerans]
MTDAMEKVLLGLKETEIIKPTEGPSPLNDEALKRYFEGAHKQIVYGPYSINRAKIRNEDTEPKSEPAS